MMTVDLGHAPNPDIGGGYWTEPIEAGKTVRVAVTDCAAASEAVRSYCKRNGLGGGNLKQAYIRVNGKRIGYVSYNGRLWSMDDTPLCVALAEGGGP